MVVRMRPIVSVSEELLNRMVRLLPYTYRYWDRHVDLRIPTFRLMIVDWFCDHVPDWIHNQDAASNPVEQGELDAEPSSGSAAWSGQGTTQPQEQSTNGWHLDPKRRKQPSDGRWSEWRRDNPGAARRSQDGEASRKKYKEYKLLEPSGNRRKNLRTFQIRLTC